MTTNKDRDGENRPSFVELLLTFPCGVAFARDGTPLRDIDDWLQHEALPAYDAYAYQIEPSRRLSLDEVRAGLAKRHERASERD